MKEIIVDIDSIDEVIEVFGNFDVNTKAIESKFSVTISNKSDYIKISGEESNADMAHQALLKLIDLVKIGNPITEQQISYIISLASEGKTDSVKDLLYDIVGINSKGAQIKPKTHGQKSYIREIEKNSVVFGIGPAGTGKTYLAMAMAVKAFKNKQVSRIVLTRPAVEAGEKLGFLPGDLQNKVDPYLRPLYDALFDIMGFEAFQKNLEKGAIEVAPLAYMRGRTLDDAFIILDEAQNTTPEQMKMFLTRMGLNSKVVVTGDVTQIDLPHGKLSGLQKAERVLNKISGISFVYLTEKDVVRHRLVQEIIVAYSKYENKEKERLKVKSVKERSTNFENKD